MALDPQGCNCDSNDEYVIMTFTSILFLSGPKGRFLSDDHRRRTALQRREKMLARLQDAALHLVAGQGMSAVTVDAVIAAADVSRGTFYKYYDRPEGLLAAIGLRFSEDLIRHFNPLANGYADPAERIGTGMRAVLHMGRDHPLIGRFIVRTGWPVVPDTHVFHQLCGPNLTAGMAAGRFTAMPMAAAYNLVVGATIGGLYTVAETVAPADYPESATAGVLRGLGLPAAEVDRLMQTSFDMPPVQSDSLLLRLAQGPSKA
jgi:TetR/AcrR family transcriptional regulator, ethionamide resistance regulator